MRGLPLILAGLALAAQPGGLLAQATKKPGAARPATKAAVPAMPSENDLKEATETLSLLVSALNSKEIPAETKAGLLICLYRHPLGQIAHNQAGALAANTQLDANSPTQRLLVIATICDAPIPKSQAAKPGADDAAPAPTPSPTPNSGR